jgi:CO2 hydration protein
MVTTAKKLNKYSNEYFIKVLQNGGALLPDSPENVMEVVGILKSYGVVLDSYSKNLIYIAENQYLVFFPFFKYFNGEISVNKLFQHLWHNRINFEYAEYCMKAMVWHGGGGLDKYLDTPEFVENANAVIAAKFQYNPLVLGVNQLFPDFLIEQLRVYCYYKGLGQFWRIMSDMFIELSDRYDRGEIKTIPDVVNHIKSALVANASHPIYYTVNIRGKEYEILPKKAGLTFLMDTAVPYVEAIFFRGTPFQGTVSFNAQEGQIPAEQAKFQYGALYADPLPVGGAGIPPTLTMQDMRHHLPDYMHQIYQRSRRGEDDLRVQICMSFQKSMFCVTTAAILGLMPHAIDTEDAKEQKANHKYLEAWLERLENSRLQIVNS